MTSRSRQHALIRHLLAAIGKSAGDFFGTDFLYSNLAPLRRWAEELLSESEVPLALDAADFVFAMHQGYTFLFFRCGIFGDPPVFLYVDNETSFSRVAGSFSSWLTAAANDDIAALAERRDGARITRAIL